MLNFFNSFRKNAERYEIRPIAGMIVPVRRDEQPNDSTAQPHVPNEIAKEYETRAIAGMIVSVQINDQAKKGMKI